MDSELLSSSRMAVPHRRALLGWMRPPARYFLAVRWFTAATRASFSAETGLCWVGWVVVTPGRMHDTARLRSPITICAGSAASPAHYVRGVTLLAGACYVLAR